MTRRDFVRNVAMSGSSALLLGQKLPQAGGQSSEHPEKPTSLASTGESRKESSPRELTVAGFQMLVSKDVQVNEKAIHRAIDQAAGVKADFLLTPEGSLSGYYPHFDQAVVAAAVQRIVQHAKESRVGLLLGTCYKEREKDTWAPDPSVEHQEFCYDQVRVYAPSGEYLGFHAKILRCSSLRHPGAGEMKDYVGGPIRTFVWNGICFGALICNDLWATPGFTTTPNPYLAWGLREMGAQVIFHSINSGPVPFYRPYHESNQSLWAVGLNIPIVSVNAANPNGAPVNCRSGVVGPDGEHKCLAHDAGEQFFSYKLSVA